MKHRGVLLLLTAAFLGITLISPQDAESYNGQQGDPWDAQKDIAIAMIGSLLAIPFVKLVYPNDKRANWYDATAGKKTFS